MARILLVDDDTVLLTLMCTLLTRMGHEVWQAKDGQQALDQLQAETFDLVITDVMMPGLDGYELTRRLREDPATRDTMVLIQTSRLQGPDHDLSVGAGADAYTLKTVNVSRLGQIVENLLDKRRQRNTKPA